MHPVMFHATALIAVVRGRAERARREGRNELGASAVEWAIISAIVVTLALVVAKVVTDVVEDRSNEIKRG
ncbi:MAG: hypothetical protein L0H93_15840 [Nocardioides sp.]|nr:hypothetical protein [Nocardioides sp.]